MADFAAGFAGAFFVAAGFAVDFAAGFAVDFVEGFTAGFGAIFFGATLLAGVTSDAFFAAGVEAGLADFVGAGFVATSLAPTFRAALGAAFGAGFEVVFAASGAAGFVTGALFFAVIVCPPSLRSLRRRPSGADPRPYALNSTLVPAP